MKKLYLGNLPYQATEADLQSWFVELPDGDADRPIQSCNGKDLHGLGSTARELHDGPLGREARRAAPVRHLLHRASNASPQLRDRFFVESDDGLQPRVDPDLIERLIRHRFTFNIRELDSLLWKAIAESPRNFVMLSRGLREDLDSQAAAQANVSTPNGSAEPSAQEIVDGLNRNANHVARTAEALGLSSRYALYRLMRKNGIVVERANDSATQP